MVCINSFSERHAIEAIRTGLNKKAGQLGLDGSVYQGWVKSQIYSALLSEAVTLTSEKDGSILADLCKSSSRGVFDKCGPLLCFRGKLIENRIVSAVERNANSTPMVVAFVTKLFEAEKKRRGH